MLQDNSSQKSFSSSSSQGRNGPRLNKPLPPINKVGSVNGIPTNRVVITGAYRPADQRAPGPTGQPLDATNAAFFNLFTRPKAQLARGYTEPVTGAAAFPFKISKPIPIDTVTTREEQARLEAIAETNVIMAVAAATAQQTTKSPQPRPTTPTRAPLSRNVDDLDTNHPPTFREILSMATKIAPASTIVKSRSTSPLVMGVSAEARRASKAPGADLARKIFVLTKSGFLLQYADRGSSERLPERLQSLTRDTVAVASDLVPGKPYTIQIAESYDMEDLSRPESPPLRNMFGMKGVPTKRTVPCTIIVLSTPEELEAWLFALRKEIQRLAKFPSDSPSASPLTKRKTIVDYETAYPPPLKLTKSQTNLRERSDSARSFPEPPPFTLSAIPAIHDPAMQDDSSDTDEYDIPTVREMYHRDLLLARQQSSNRPSERVVPMALPKPPDPPRQINSRRSLPRASMVSTMTREGFLEITYDPMPVIPATMKTERSMSVPLLVNSLGPDVVTRPRVTPAQPPLQPRMAPAIAPAPPRAPQAVPPTTSENLVSAPRKDSLLPDSTKPASSVAHVANMRKRMSYGARPTTLRSQTDIGLVAVDSSLSKAKTGVAINSVKESTMREVTRLDNDEYHDFQQDLYTGKPSTYKPENFSRRHSLINGVKYRTVNTSMMARPRGASVTEKGVRVPIRNTPARLPLGVRSQTQPLMQNTMRIAPEPQPVKPVMSLGPNPLSVPPERKLIRPASIKIRSDAAPFVDSLPQAYKPKDAQQGGEQRRSEYYPGKKQHTRSQSNVTSDEDDATSLPIQGTKELINRAFVARPTSQVGLQSALNLGPPMAPPPMAPLPPRPS